MKQSERGFTLMEVVVAIGIVALITGAATMAVFQVVRGTERTNEHIGAVCQVRDAGYWIGRDTKIAQSVELSLPAGFPFTLSRTDWDSGDEHQVVYSLEDMAGTGLKKLQRSHSVNGAASETNIVAQYIDHDPVKTKCEFIDGVLIFTVTASVSFGSQVENETRTFNFVPRPGL